LLWPFLNLLSSKLGSFKRGRQILCVCLACLRDLKERPNAKKMRSTSNFLCIKGYSRLWCTKRYILYEKNVFWTHMHFLTNKVICLLSLNKCFGEKIIVKIA
jgi:hypothetical protein